MGTCLNHSIDTPTQDPGSGIRLGMTTKKRQWKELSPGARRAATIAVVIQVVLLALAHRDISRRPAAQIRGKKTVWRLVTLVNFIGPLTYFACGRRKG